MQKDNHIIENFENRLDEFAPKLSSVGKENPFDVPADYFETLPEDIIAKCNATEKENSFISNFKIILNPRLYIPVAVSVIIIILVIINTPVLRTTDDQQLAMIDYGSSAEYQYVDSLIDNGDIDESLLMETITGIDDTSKSSISTTSFENNISEINKSTIILDDTLNNILITDDDIIQYLLDDDDNDDIINN
jgi:hypothetical protein